MRRAVVGFVVAGMVLAACGGGPSGEDAAVVLRLAETAHDAGTLRFAGQFVGPSLPVPGGAGETPDTGDGEAPVGLTEEEDGWPGLGSSMLVEFEGDVDFGARRSRIVQHVTVDGKPFGEPLVVIVADGVFYQHANDGMFGMSLDTGGAEWILVRPDPADGEMMTTDLLPFDPRTGLGLFEQPGVTIERRGRGAARDTPCDRYEVDWEGAAETPPWLLAGSLSTSLCVDGAGRLLRLEAGFGDGSFLVEFYDFGEPVEIELPDSAAVVDANDLFELVSYPDQLTGAWEVVAAGTERGLDWRVSAAPAGAWTCFAWESDPPLAWLSAVGSRISGGFAGSVEEDDSTFPPGPDGSTPSVCLPPSGSPFHDVFSNPIVAALEGGEGATVTLIAGLAPGAPQVVVRLASGEATTLDTQTGHGIFVYVGPGGEEIAEVVTHPDGDVVCARVPDGWCELLWW